MIVASTSDAVERVGAGGPALDPEVVSLLMGAREKTIRWRSSPRASGRSSG